MTKKVWRCTHRDCKHRVVTFIPLSDNPYHTHVNTKKTYRMEEVK
jgi:hypothetical protein